MCFPLYRVGCDLYHGNWIHDPSGPLYTNNSCPLITQMQNCQGNGRPDKDYENWRWKPFQCDIPRFDPKKFLELMRGRTLAFIGDSVARNQMESMLCILWQVIFLLDSLLIWFARKIKWSQDDNNIHCFADLSLLISSHCCCIFCDFGFSRTWGTS